jgi:hypothetical protein
MTNTHTSGSDDRFGPKAVMGIAGTLAIAAIVGVTIGSPPPARTQAPPEQGVVARLVGTYRNVAPDGGRGAIETATDIALDEARPLVRALAKPRILDTNLPFERVAITSYGTDVEVAFDGRRYRAPLGGPPADLRAPDGSAMDLSYEVEGDALVAYAATSRGTSRTTYVPTGDGVHLTTVIESDRLPAPVRYSMRLRRD